MTQLDLKGIEELKEIAKELDLDFEITEEFIKKIRHLHFIKGFSWADTQDALELASTEATRKIFLEILGYPNWDAYHKNRTEILEKKKSKMILPGDHIKILEGFYEGEIGKIKSFDGLSFVVKLKNKSLEIKLNPDDFELIEDEKFLEIYIPPLK